MATSGSFSTNQVAATTRVWYWDFSWSVSSWSGNTATVSWSATARCTSGTSGQRYVSNYGFGGAINGNNISNPGGTFYKDTWVASGSCTIGGGTTFSANIWAHPYSTSYTSSGSGTWTLDNNVTTPTVTCTIGSRTETTVACSMSVTNSGNASITDRYIDIFTDSGCTNKVGTINGASGTFTGLSANTKYYCRANASNGTYRGYSSVPSTTTYAYPYCTSSPNFTIGNNVTVSFYNPLNRSIQIRMWSHANSQFMSDLITTSGTSYTFSGSSIKNNLYASIPAATSSKYNIDVHYGGNKAVRDNGNTYSIIGSNKEPPTFTSFNYTDTDPLASYLTGKYGVTNPGVLVAGLSDCIFTVPVANKATSSYGATLDHYAFVWSNGSSTTSTYSSTADVSNHVYDGNSTTISVTAYDKRGQYKTVSKSVTIISPSKATGSLTTKRKNGIESTVYLNGSITYWCGDWTNGSSRPNQLYNIYMQVGSGSLIDITSAFEANATSSVSGNKKTWKLNTDALLIYQGGTTGDAFAVGTEYTIKFYVATGQEYNSTKYYYDKSSTVINTTYVSSGLVGLTRFKETDGKYYYGINKIPDTADSAHLQVDGGISSDGNPVFGWVKVAEWDD